MSSVTIIFQDYLQELLSKKNLTGGVLQHDLERRASIKDVIESLGVPHPVVDRLTVNQREVGFDYILQHGDIVEAKPLVPPVNPMVPTMLRPEPLKQMAFVVDVNVGKLALFLRMLGFDTVYDTDIRNNRLAEISASGKKILLTRDISLLKRKIVMHGYLVQKQDPAAQLAEVVRLYDLSSSIKPLSRCIPCNGLLVPVAKEAVWERLEPLTQKYYDTFYLCDDCGRIYWPGSHQEKMNVFIQKVLQVAQTDQIS